MTTIPTLFVYFFYDHIPTFFCIFKKCFLLLVIIIRWIEVLGFPVLNWMEVLGLLDYTLHCLPDLASV